MTMTHSNNTQQVPFGFERLSPEEKTTRVQHVFDHSAERYDLMNDIMSLGMHIGWKQKAVEYAQIQPGDTVLDLACGTCDITYALLQKQPKCHITATDPNAAMLALGQDRLLDMGIYRQVTFCLSYAESLPFAHDHFQVAICAFGFRNFTDHAQALRELYRVIRPGGQVIILEFSKPTAELLQYFYRYYADLIPSIGALVADEKASYQYLVDSIDQHMDAATCTAYLRQSGFESIQVTSLLSGLVCIHRGIKC